MANKVCEELITNMTTTENMRVGGKPCRKIAL